MNHANKLVEIPITFKFVVESLVGLQFLYKLPNELGKIIKVF